MAEVIHAVDGPIALTECIHDSSGECDLEASCPARGSWQVINDVVRRALSSVSLADVIIAAPVADQGGAFAAMGNTAAHSVKEN